MGKAVFPQMYYEMMKVEFQCVKRNGATLAGVRFRCGDRILVQLDRDWSAADGIAQGGSWSLSVGSARYSRAILKDIAWNITDLQTGGVIWKRKQPTQMVLPFPRGQGKKSTGLAMEAFAHEYKEPGIG